MLEREDIQGLVFSGYARQPFARYWFLDFRERAAASWLSRLLFRISTSERRERRPGRRLNVAFSASGLRALRLPEAALATFPRSFLDGMAAPACATALGDHGENAAEHWDFGGARGRVDALVLAYASTPDELDEESDELEDDFERHGFESHVEDAYLPADRRGHFGFLDARSNPRLRRGFLPRRQDPLERALPPGEFVLGYRNADGHFAPSPRAPLRTSARPLPPLTDARRAVDLGRNGTFVAVRKLAQDVHGFWGFAAKTGRELWPEAGAHAATRLAEQLVGRTLDGARLERCPLGAHVRRANPRDSLDDDPKASLALVQKHRMIRRGRLYGARLAAAAEPDAQARGLLFLALCADLERQFEFVHEAWLKNPKFAGYTQERDPIAPWDAAASGAPDGFSLGQPPFRRKVRLERFVRVRGGAYLFMPGLRALSYLAEG